MQMYDRERRGVDDRHRTLFLHIGTGKAGSTSLQHSFQMVRDSSLGVLPVQAFGFPNATNLVMSTRNAQAHSYFVMRHRIVTEAEFGKNAETIWEKARSEIENSEVEHFIASSEFLNAMVRGKDIEMLKHELEKLFCRIEVIIYLRDQRSFLRSLWAQSVKGPSKSTESFDEFLAALDKRYRLWNYSLFIKDWLRVFGEDAIKVTMFDPQALYKKSIVADFFHKVGLKEVPFEVTRVQNVTPNDSEIEIIRRNNLLKSGSMSSITRHIPVMKATEPEKYEAFILDKVSEGNQWINNVFFDDHPVRLPVSI